ncbi:MAG TPA: hypothetical protein VGR01_14920 [Burkholderiales bacterium]|jgi:hypothetical protein|nr:hypothetical protein [Burkholderiales bacterium]
MSMPTFRFNELGDTPGVVVVFESDRELGTIRLETPSGRYKFTPTMPELWPIPYLVDDDPKELNARIEALVSALMEISASIATDARSKPAASGGLTSGREAQDPPKK